MKKVSENIERKFYKVLNGQISIKDFESWVYDNIGLENELLKSDYIDLISINFNQKHVLIEIEKLISKYIDFGKFETENIQKILSSIINRDINIFDSIESTYDLYCYGYSFLQRLGMMYGLLAYNTPSSDYQKSWREISEYEQNKLLDSFYPEIVNDARMVLDWIKEGKIVIRNEVNGSGGYVYDDYRSPEEIQMGNSEQISSVEEKSPVNSANKISGILKKIIRIFK